MLDKVDNINNKKDLGEVCFAEIGSFSEIY